MKIVTGAQMKAFDAQAIKEYALPSLILMENAGRNVAEAILERWELRGARVLALSGKGNNGGDALCAARHLLHTGALVEGVIAGVPNATQLSEETRTQAAMLEKFGVPLRFIGDEQGLPVLEEALGRADLVIDGLLGIGVKGAVRGLYEPVIERVTTSDIYVISVDLPSGVEADTGRVEGVAVQADLTVTLEYPKLGLLLYPGREHVGELVVRPVGYPEALKQEFESGLEWVDDEFVRGRLPRRRAYSHKGDYGRVLIVAGSRGLSGAALLTGDAALRAGAGLVYLGYPESLSPVIEGRLLEAVKFPLPEEGGALAEAAAPEIEDIIKNRRMDVVALGPGLSQRAGVKRLIRKLLPKMDVPVVIDADGLNNLADAEGRKILKRLHAPALLTPHPGELSRLIARQVSEIEAHRVDVTRETAQELGVLLVLKGVPTVTASPCGDVYINSTGNSGLATGGSGDVLTGMIAGLMAQGLAPAEAAPTGVYLHGRLADRLKSITGERAMLPRDLLNMMPEVLKEFE